MEERWRTLGWWLLGAVCAGLAVGALTAVLAPRPAPSRVQALDGGAARARR